MKKKIIALLIYLLQIFALNNCIFLYSSLKQVLIQKWFKDTDAKCIDITNFDVAIIRNENIAQRFEETLAESVASKKSCINFSSQRFLPQFRLVL